MEDYYQILCISPSASQKEIVSAYRAKVRELHIGDNPIAELTPEQQEVEEAYQVLYDDKKRKQYDTQNGFGTNNPWDYASHADDEEVGLGESLAIFIFMKCFIPFLWLMMILGVAGIARIIWATIEAFSNLQIKICPTNK